MLALAGLFMGWHKSSRLQGVLARFCKAKGAVAGVGVSESHHGSSYPQMLYAATVTLLSIWAHAQLPEVP